MTTWTNPKTINTNDPAPATDWNTYIRDDLLFLFQPPIMVVYKSAPQTIGNGSFTVLTWDSVLIDSTATPQFDDTNDTWVCRLAGWYEFVTNINMALLLGASDRRLLEFGHNGVRHRVQTQDAIAGLGWAITGTRWFQCAVGDTVDVRLYHDAGQNLDTGSGTEGPRFMARLIHGL